MHPLRFAPLCLCSARSDDRRSCRVCLLLVAVTAMAMGDLAMTLTWLNSVGMLEANPLARLVMGLSSPWAVVLWRGLSLILGLFILYRLRRRPHAEVGAWICFVAMGLLSAHWLSVNASAATLTSDYADASIEHDPRYVAFAGEQK